MKNLPRKPKKSLPNGFKELKRMEYDLLRHISKSLDVINQTNKTNNLQLKA